MFLTIHYKIQSNTIRLIACLILEVKMKIKMEVEIDTENTQDLNTIEELIAVLRNLAESYYEE